jgi:hypothetical protein
VCGCVKSVVVKMSPEEIEAKRKEEEAAMKTATASE